MWFWSDNPKSCCQLVVWPLSCMPATSNGRKPSEQRNFKLFAHRNTCDSRRHNGSIAAWSWNRAYQPECQDNWWGAQSVIGLPVLSVLVLDLLRDSFTRQGCQPRGGGKEDREPSCVEMNPAHQPDGRRGTSGIQYIFLVFKRFPQTEIDFVMWKGKSSFYCDSKSLLS